MALTRITKGVIKPNENYDTHDINSTGIITATGANITGNMTVGGVLTYEDVTSIDSVGLITARNGIDCNGDLDVDGHTNLDNVSIAGLTTANQLRFLDNKYLQIGNSQDLQLYHDGNHSYVNSYNGTGNLYVSGNSVRVQSNDNRLVNLSGTDIIKTDTTTAYLYHNGSVRMQTSSVGITVNNDLDVDGHTNLDNVSIAGIITAANGINCTTDGVGNGINIGASQDLIIQHNGTNSFIDNNTGDLYIQTTGSGDDILIESADDFTVTTATKTAIEAIGDGAVKIYHNGSTDPKIYTNSIGVTVDNVLYISGPAGNPGRLRFQEGGALSEIRGVRNTDDSSFLYFDTEIGGTTATRLIIDGSGHLRAATDSTYDLGTSAVRWRNVYADTLYGDGSNLTGIVGVPSGCIILWSGAANAIPSGFVLCNGSNSTPDLRGKFVVGYHNSNGDYDVGDTGGAETVTLSEAQMPSHNHTFSSSHTHGSGSYTTNTTGNHSHTWQRQDVGINVGYRPWPASNNDCRSTNVSTSNAGNHSHSISGTSGSGTASGNTGNKGSGNAHENRPPYYALCYIMKT